MERIKIGEKHRKPKIPYVLTERTVCAECRDRGEKCEKCIVGMAYDANDRLLRGVYIANLKATRQEVKNRIWKNKMLKK